MQSKKEKNMFYIVATPIGNLQDITLRALETLKSVDFIVCEDTRVTAKLLNHYQIKKPLLSYHQRSKQNKVEQIISKLREGKNLALVTDAGTPGISDPGNELVAVVRKQIPTVKIIPIPGPSAFTALASVAGVNLQKFVFLGFPPNKKGRKNFFEEVRTNLLENNYPVFYYESPYRFIKNLELLQKTVPGAKMIIGRELSKKFEEIREGEVSEILNHYQENKDKIRGEFTVLVVASGK